jgi:hypothetical protein
MRKLEVASPELADTFELAAPDKPFVGLQPHAPSST